MSSTPTLLTGAAGMIGHRVAKALLEAGHDVTAVDAVTPDKGPTLKRHRLDQLQSRSEFTFHEQDIRDRETLAAIVAEANPDAVVNLAALAGVRASLEAPQSYHETNATGTLNLLELCREHDVGTFVLASTSSLYGHANDPPYSENQSTGEPPSPYAASKKAAEAYAATYSELYGIDVAVPRYFTVYGPAGRPDMAMFRFVRWVMEGEPITLYGDGTQRRDFTYVEDIARGTLACMEAVEGFEVVNLGNDDPVTLNHLVSLIEKHVGEDADITYDESHPADLDVTAADISKARDVLGWEPEVSLEEGVERTVAWHREHRDLARRVDLGDV
jgi:nucleoside-diphosphate-sugar epimerase